MLSPNQQTQHPLLNIAFSYLKSNQPQLAIASFSQYLSQHPKDKTALFQIASTYQDLNLPQQAITHYQQLLSLEPKHLFARINLGTCLIAQGKIEPAKNQFDLVLQQDPNNFYAHNNLANIFKAQGQIDKAIENYLSAIEANQTNSSCYYNLGTVLHNQGKLDLAISQYQTALELDPNDAQIHNNLGIALGQSGQFEDSILHHQKAIQLDPDLTTALSSLYIHYLVTCQLKQASKIKLRLKKLIQNELISHKKPGITPFISLILHPTPAINFQIAKSYTRDLLQTNTFNYTPSKKPLPTPLNIGYITNGFADFPTAHNLSGVLELHNHQKFHIHAYSYGQPDTSWYRQRIENCVDQLVDISNFSAYQAAKKIHKDNIHILVDLKGHSDNNRLDIFSFRPAPVQVSFLGYPGTTGTPFMDYIIADDIVLPPDQYEYFSETPVILPYCYRPTDNQTLLPEEQASRPQHQLPPQAFVFASFNNTYKLNLPLLNTWIRILHETPNSVLWQYTKFDKSQENLTNFFKSRGIPPERLIFAPHLPKHLHFQRLGLADLMLDSFPISGHTTITDACIANLPFISLRHRQFIGRVSSSVLHYHRLDELITHSYQDYFQTALTLAKNPKILHRIRQKLSHMSSYETLLNTPQFTQLLETSYKKMWRQFQSQQPKSPIRIGQSDEQ